VVVYNSIEASCLYHLRHPWAFDDGGSIGTTRPWFAAIWRKNAKKWVEVVESGSKLHMFA
jgi:hypothetical protein